MITATVTGEDDCLVQGETIKAKRNTSGKRYVKISPKSQETDANGEATFEITAKKSIGKAKITFKINDAKKSLRVRVKTKK